MPKSLIVAEKPSVGRDIAKALGGFEDHKEYLESEGYVISWAIGHLVEFKEPEEIDPKYKQWKLEDLPILPAPFEFKAKSGHSARLGILKKLFHRKDVADVVNACDAGREGELIFRELTDYFASKKPIRRLWLQSMTPTAIQEGFRNLKPGADYDRLGDAARCRSEADWLIGINATRALTRRMKTRMEKSSWSAGRVQTPTLAMLADREIEILTFRPTPFWRIQGTFAASSHQYDGTWFDPKFQADPDRPRKDDWITDEAQLNRILDEVRGQTGVAEETRKPATESAPPLFDLTTLQREANRRFGMSARRTLSAAQKLYEGYKLITYPRTDSRCLPSDYRPPVQQVLGMLDSGGGDYGKAARFLKSNGLQNEGRIFDDKGVSDHFAIIPTAERAPAALQGDEARVYDLIVRRFLAAFYPPAMWIRVERVTKVAGHHFRTRSRHLAKAGWYEVYGRDAEAEKDRELPALIAGQDKAADVPSRNVSVEPVADQTRPPARINEGRLLSLMENAGKAVNDEDLARVLHEKGLGTPATRAEIIEALISRQYVERADRALKTTTKGVLLIDMLRRIQVQRLASPELTGELEHHLRQVEDGERQRDAFMTEIQDYTLEVVQRAKDFEYGELYKKDPPLGTCPVCRQKQVFEQARFYACEDNTGKGTAACNFIIWKEKGGRYLDRVTISELIARGETDMLEGFTSARGQGYKAKLRLNSRGELEMEAEGGGNGGGEASPGAAALPVSDEPLGPCPFHAECEVIETPTHFACRGVCVEKAGRKAGLSLPRVVCQRVVERDEALHYLANRETEMLENFISRFGKPFKAKLVLKDTGKHGFEFAPREAGAGRRGRGKAAPAEGEGAEAKPKAARGKAAAKKAPARGTKASAAKAPAKAKPAAKSPAKSKPAAKAKSTGAAAAKKPTRARVAPKS